MAERFAATLDCADIAFINDQILDDLPLPSQLGATRTGGVDLNKPRIRAALSAALVLTAAPRGFTVADFTAKVHAITRHTGYTTRQAAYDLRELRGKISSPNPAGHGPTSRSTPPAPSPPCSHCVTRSSPRSWPASAAHARDANPPP
jgi:hypothetical protein